MNIVKRLSEEFKNINPISKFIIKSSGVLVTALFTLGACFLICAGRTMDYYAAYALAADLIGCIKPSLGVMLLGALLFEAVKAPQSDK